ncbi:MAG: histidine ammonia-lyase [Sphingobacteriaceae bacterium]|nr:histidine ammonia-lyase [Sphingobacteriaceae bacterium]
MFTINQQLSLQALKPLMQAGNQIQLAPEAVQRIQKGKKYLDDKLAGSDALFYGINTGFGALCNIGISKSELNTLQHNLIRSHACGMGEEVPAEIVRLMLLLKVQSLAFGHSGVALETVQRLIDFYNMDILPVVYQQGSLGASGDLAPLAHLSLPLIGEGEVIYAGKRQSTSLLFEALGWKSLQLQAKEGLALLNGTQFMSAYGVHALLKSSDMLNKADFIAAASLDAFDGRLEPFHPAIHAVRPHPGQMKVADNVCEFLEGSALQAQVKTSVQDPYSFRCIPQVHGATRDVWDFVAAVFEREINSVSDNPNIFPELDLIISGGNFHGQPLAMALDQLAIALSEIGSISERRIFQLISGTRGLPPFLTANSGLNSGFMIPQYTAASIASQNKQLAVPASIDSITSSNGQEDHVSMGANAATKLYRLLENVQRILSIEWMNACQALDFRTAKSSPRIEAAKADYRKVVAHLDGDRYLHEDMLKSETFIADWKW